MCYKLQKQGFSLAVVGPTPYPHKMYTGVTKFPSIIHNYPLYHTEYVKVTAYPGLHQYFHHTEVNVEGNFWTKYRANVSKNIPLARMYSI